MNVTVATELTRTLLGMTIEQMNEAAANAPAESEGILLLPYFNGERTPALPNGKATLFGLTSTNYTPSNLTRCAMEGATFGLRYGLDVLQQQGISPEEIRLVGGGAKSSLWRQIVADLFNTPVVCPVSTEAGTVGAALQAMWCYLQTKGGAVAIADLTERYVFMDQSTRTTPEPCRSSRYADFMCDI